jgi:hypothetical protein
MTRAPRRGECLWHRIRRIPAPGRPNGASIEANQLQICDVGMGFEKVRHRCSSSGNVRLKALRGTDPVDQIVENSDRLCFSEDEEKLLRKIV